MRKKSVSHLGALTFKVIMIIVFGFTITGCTPEIVNDLKISKKVKPFNYSNTLNYEEVTKANPLKGFVALDNEETTFPHSLKYYGFNLNEVQLGYNEFDWTALERSLEESKREGKQAIIRFYVDYPGKQSGIPDFLLKDGLKVYSYTVKGQAGTCPDYSNVKLKEALVNFVNEFGKRYDGDPRIGFIEAGLLGFWGGWHTYPYDNWYPTETVYREIGTAYMNAFKNTHIMVGEVEESVSDLGLGYHDDAFAVDTVEVAQMMNQCNVSNNWLTKPMGAELELEIQDDYFEALPLQGTIDWDKSVSLIHASWCINNAILYYEGEEKQKAIDAGYKLGYNFTVNNANVNYNNGELQVNVEMLNTGIAPFYYDWNIELRLTDSTGKEILVKRTDWSLREIKELNKEHTFKDTLKDVQFEADSTYTLSMKVINPMEGGGSLYFANKEQKDDGWLDLITMTVNK